MDGLNPVPFKTHNFQSGFSSKGSRGAQSVDGRGQAGGESLLGLGRQFGALAGEIEDVDGGLALGVDQGHLDIAVVCAEGEGNLAQ